MAAVLPCPVQTNTICKTDKGNKGHKGHKVSQEVHQVHQVRATREGRVMGNAQVWYSRATVLSFANGHRMDIEV